MEKQSISSKTYWAINQFHRKPKRILKSKSLAEFKKQANFEASLNITKILTLVSKIHSVF